MFVGANDPSMCHGRECLEFAIKGYHIEDGARIAIGVTVLPDITIGKNAFIGAGAVVTKDIPDNAIAIGVPAKVKVLVPENERL
jgi:acetyltransferase-like isoleucine patch superfamily enzyme